MYCKKCGTRNEEGMTYCRTCGYRLIPSSSNSEDRKEGYVPVGQPSAFDSVAFPPVQDEEDATTFLEDQTIQTEEEPEPTIRPERPPLCEMLSRETKAPSAEPEYAMDAAQRQKNRQPQNLYPELSAQERAPKLAMFIVYDLLFLIPFVNVVLAVVLTVAGETKTTRRYGLGALIVLLVLLVVILLIFFIPGWLGGVRGMVDSIVNFVDYLL